MGTYGLLKVEDLAYVLLAIIRGKGQRPMAKGYSGTLPDEPHSDTSPACFYGMVVPYS